MTQLTQYGMQWCSWVGEVQWEYKFHMASDSMAIDYASRHLARLAKEYDCVRSMLVWREPDVEIIADLVIELTWNVTNRKT